MVLRLRQHNIGYTADGFYKIQKRNITTTKKQHKKM